MSDYREQMAWVDIKLDPPKTQQLICGPKFHRHYMRYLAFSGAWQLYGKKLGYT